MDGTLEMPGHLLRRDLLEMGLELPLRRPPAIPKRRGSKHAQEAVREAENIIQHGRG